MFSTIKKNTKSIKTTLFWRGKTTFSSPSHQACMIFFLFFFLQLFLELLGTTISLSLMNINGPRDSHSLPLHLCFILAKDLLYCLFLVVENACQRSQSSMLSKVYNNGGWPRLIIGDRWMRLTHQKRFYDLSLCL